MAKLKDYKRILMGEEFSFPIRVNSAGQFSTTYPVSILQSVEYHNQFASLQELYAEINRVIKEVENQQTVVENLLVYKVKGGFSEKSSTPHASLEIVYTLYQKTTIGKSISYNYINFDTFKSHSPDHCVIPLYYVLGNQWKGIHGLGGADPTKDNILPLTLENVRFFEMICSQLNTIRKRLEDFTKDAPLLQNAIAAKSLLLIESKYEGEK